MTYENYFEKVEKAALFIQERIKLTPKVMVVLSGGLDGFTKYVEEGVEIAAADIPFFPIARAEGHSGKLVFGWHGDIPLCTMFGRFHYYEGHTPQEVVFPLFVMERLGVKILIAVNATGGVNRSFKAGDIMIVTDHINMMGSNPLIGLAVQRKNNQFTSLARAYDQGLSEIAEGTAKRLKIGIKKGVYIATCGPSYETKAEIRVYRDMGADAVGMSTVPEVIAANFLGIKVLALSCIANSAADLHKDDISHEEVLAVMKETAPKVIRLLNGVLDGMSL